MSDAQQKLRADQERSIREADQARAAKAAQHEDASGERERLKAEREVATMQEKVEEAEAKAEEASQRVAELEAKMSEAMMNAGIGFGSAHTITADHTGKPAKD